MRGESTAAIGTVGRGAISHWQGVVFSAHEGQQGRDVAALRSPPRPCSCSPQCARQARFRSVRRRFRCRFDRVASFTPATADPQARRGLRRSRQLGDRFQIHARRAKGRPSQIRVAIRARADNRRPVRPNAPRPARDRRADPGQLQSRRSGRLEAVRACPATSPRPGPPASRSAAARARWSASIIRSRSVHRPRRGRRRAQPTAPSRRRSASRQGYALDVGGAYALTRSIALTGGVRYKVERDRDRRAQGRAPRQPGGLRRHRV